MEFKFLKYIKKHFFFEQWLRLERSVEFFRWENTSCGQCYFSFLVCNAINVHWINQRLAEQWYCVQLWQHIHELCLKPRPLYPLSNAHCPSHPLTCWVWIWPVELVKMDVQGLALKASVTHRSSQPPEMDAATLDVTSFSPSRMELCLHCDTPAALRATYSSWKVFYPRPYWLLLPLRSLAPSLAPGPDESPRGHACIFDRGAGHLEPTRDKTTLPSFPAFLPAACHTSIHLPPHPPPLLQILPSLPDFRLGCFSSSQMVYGCTWETGECHSPLTGKCIPGLVVYWTYFYDWICWFIYCGSWINKCQQVIVFGTFWYEQKKKSASSSAHQRSSGCWENPDRCFILFFLGFILPHLW